MAKANNNNQVINNGRGATTRVYDAAHGGFQVAAMYEKLDSLEEGIRSGTVPTNDPANTLLRLLNTTLRTASHEIAVKKINLSLQLSEHRLQSRQLMAGFPSNNNDEPR